MGLKLEVSQAEYRYDAAQSSGFSDINFSLRDGEVMSILGPNGCGKTTLLKCLNNLFKLQRGSVVINDRDISRLPRSEIAKSIGYVPQMHQPIFPFSVLDAVLVGRTPHLGLLASPGQEDIRIADEAMAEMGISHLRDKAYTQISGGERQLVMFARVLAQKPALLLLDEPTSHLDFGNQIRLLRIVQKLSAGGLPIIMTSHFPDHAFLVSTKVALMYGGRFLDSGRPQEVMTDDNLGRLYNLKVKVVNLNSGINRSICVPVEDCAPVIPSQNMVKSGGNMNEFEGYLQKAGDYHGHICGGIVLGTKISLAAMQTLGLDPAVKNKNLIVYAEIDRCMTDAVQVITGCSLGHRSLKYIDYGKFAATFVDLESGKAVRATVKESFNSNIEVGELARSVAQTADADMLVLKEVHVDIAEMDLPGFPKQKANCTICGERIMDGREVYRDNQALCRACANGKYYTEKLVKSKILR
jgi:iron complex transport system ATP-binding protein